MSNTVEVVTRQSSLTGSTSFRYLKKASPPFDDRVFDDQRLATEGLLQGTAEAGRGNTYYVEIAGHELVLRHYRRGGLARQISQSRYFYTGLERTRAVMEFSVLLRLARLGLPAPRVYACQVSRHGLSYAASLVTYRIPGQTLANLLKSGNTEPSLWKCVGICIAQFHQHGLCHADLNAHNIMIDSLGRVSLLDFDRARFRVAPLSGPTSGWRAKNIARLKRSLSNLASSDLPADLPRAEQLEADWVQLLTAWKNTLTGIS